MSSPPSPEFLSLQSALAGRYSIERELGRGGMGVVYLAHEVALERPVALKLLPPALAGRAGLRERFLTEARTAARLSHPHIVPIFTVDEVDGFVFFSMALVSGETLGERVRRQGPLPTAEVVRILREVAWALAYAHAQGVVHRDVKPDNVLLEAPSGRALVTDFGIARGIEESGSARTHEVIGTAELMSPEQARGEAVDARSDIYSLGVLGFYALTGRFPFRAESAPALLAMHLSEPAPPVASVAPGVPARLAKVIDRCLRKDPADRFPDGEALSEALGQSTPAERQIPVALRVFINHIRGAYGSGTGAALLVLLFLPGLLVQAAQGGFVALIGLMALAGAIGLGPLAIVGVRARKMIRAGYGLDELRLALAQDVRRREEELHFEFGAKPTRLDRILRWGAYAGLGVAVSATAVLTAVPSLFGAGPFMGLLGASFLGGSVSGVIAASRLRSRRDITGQRWLRFWKGRFGKWLFGAAGVGAGEASALAAPTYRPTELVIGLSADRLFEQLTRAERRSLEGLPETVRKLEADSKRMRQRVEELDRLLAELGDEDAAAGIHASAGAAARASTRPANVAVGADERADLRAELTEARDLAETRRTELLTALEKLRLGLLRMQAGTDNVASVTMELSAARGISADIDGLIEGQREVERLLGASGPIGVPGEENPPWHPA